MPALAEVLPTTSTRCPPARTSKRPVCTICSDTMVAAEASAFLSEDVVSYLWSCETCGYGFVTSHATRPRAA